MKKIVPLVQNYRLQLLDNIFHSIFVFYINLLTNETMFLYGRNRKFWDADKNISERHLNEIVQLYKIKTPELLTKFLDNIIVDGDINEKIPQVLYKIIGKENDITDNDINKAFKDIIDHLDDIKKHVSWPHRISKNINANWKDVLDKEKLYDDDIILQEK